MSKYIPNLTFLQHITKFKLGRGINRKLHFASNITIINNQATFQEYINSVLKKYLDRLCIDYLNDSFIYFIDSAKYTNDIQAVFKQL